MSYTIKIERTTSTIKSRRQWLKVRDIKDACKTDRNNYNEPSAPETHPKEYEYVDDEWPQAETTTIYTQTVDSLDVVAVITAINRMKP